MVQDGSMAVMMGDIQWCGVGVGVLGCGKWGYGADALELVWVAVCGEGLLEGDVRAAQGACGDAMNIV